MKVLQINTVYAQGSTGKIAKDLHDLCLKQGIDCLTGCRCIENKSEAFEDELAISSKWDSRIHGWFARFTMFKGMGSFFKTLKFLKKIKTYSPDLIHLHNLHGSYVNLPLLFYYIKKNNIPVVWTLHDCWPFTAICSNFTIAECDKWKMCCGNCPQRNRFSSSPVDFTKIVWKIKKRLFTNVLNVTIVTPSSWLSENAKKSFLKEHNIITIHNGIDLQVFSPKESDFRRKYGLENKKIVLGVAFGWGYAKGLDVMMSLAERLSDDYKIVLVGTDEKTDLIISDKVLSIHRTKDQMELAKIYTEADVFVNPTREDNFPTVNLEALACGTPIVTFNTGGSPESIDSTCGSVVAVDGIDAMEKEIIRICTKHPYSKEDCRKRAKLFDKDLCFKKYIMLYNKVTGKCSDIEN